MQKSHQKCRWFFRTGNLWCSTSTLAYPRGISSHWPSDLIWLPPETDQTRPRGPRKMGHRRSGGAQQSGDCRFLAQIMVPFLWDFPAFQIVLQDFSGYFIIYWSFMKIWVMFSPENDVLFFLYSKHSDFSYPNWELEMLGMSIRTLGSWELDVAIWHNLSG